MACIVDNQQQVINAFDLFGDEAEKLLETCYKVFQDSLYPYKGIYRSPLRPSILEYRQEYFDNGGDSQHFIYFARHERRLWEKQHPEELEKEAKAKREWDESRENDFRLIAEIVSRHNLQVEWLGGVYSDIWNIYSNDIHRSLIAQIHCM
ncbi:MAG: hypothetical protein V8R51_03710 [Clostridia bacterium]